MDVSIIIVNYNVRRFLENALGSVQTALRGLTGEIIVVDNASDDGSVEMVRSKFPGVVLIANQDNVGFARANNMALSRARGEFLLLLNPDTIMQEDTLRAMLDFFAQHPEAGLAGCKILNPDGSFQLSCRRSFPSPWVAFTRMVGLSTLFPRSRSFGRYNLTYLDQDSTYPVEAISGSFMMMRRATYEIVGGLDEAFFMYGEDLDWCYRVRASGATVFYVHSTQIVHFKGESTRRSSIDEIGVFYQAMKIFVRKHFSRSIVVRFLLSVAITLRAAVAFAVKALRAMVAPAADGIIVALAMVLGEFLYFGRMWRLPSYAYPLVWIVPALVVVLSCSFAGVYTSRRRDIARAALAVIVSFVIIAATVFFVKTFAFSRAMAVIAGAISFVLVPGWRLVVRVLGISQRRGSLFGRRTVIVGTGDSAREVLRRLRARVDDGYEVVGFIDQSSVMVGERISGIEVLGNFENVGKVLAEHHVSEVIFSIDGLTYADILSVIGSSGSPAVNFRLVPNSLEAIIGKTRIDELDNLPLIDIDYNIRRLSHRAVKRGFDIVLSLILLIFCYPIILAVTSLGWKPGVRARAVLSAPRTFTGHLSFVGRPTDLDTIIVESGVRHASPGVDLRYLGPAGVTGLVQINRRDDLTDDEIRRYLLYYAKNQSLLLDLEILLKALILSRS